MFSPVGYVSLKEVEDKARDVAAHGFTSADFHQILKEVSAVFVTDTSGSVIRMAPGLLAVGNDGEYLFVSRSTWIVNLERLRNQPTSGSGLRVGLFCRTRKECDEFPDDLLRHINFEYAETLARFEGWAVVVSEGDADELTREIKGFQPKRDVIKHGSAQEEEEAFKAYVASFGESDTPTNSAIEDWGSLNSMSRLRIREMKTNFAPPHWSRPGPRT